jgi:hypothetical protein
MTPPLSRVKVTVEALTVDGDLIVVSVPRELPTPQEATDWPYPTPPQGQDPIAWVIDEASKRARAALDAMEPKGSRTFGEAAQAQGDWADASARLRESARAGMTLREAQDRMAQACRTLTPVTIGIRPAPPVQPPSDVRQGPDTPTFAKHLQSALGDALDPKQAGNDERP